MTAMEKMDVAVIGAGVVGLAVARALSLTGREVLLLDRAPRIGSETSSRNSEVIHGGLYYPNASWKATMCVRGRHLLYNFCEQRNVAYQKIGKLIVATEQSQTREVLPNLYKNAKRNGVNDVALLSREDISILEPQVKSYGALWSPSTGIVDSHEFMLSILAEAEEYGTTLALHTNVANARIVDNRIHLYASGIWMDCNTVINCAGLWADQIARLLHSKSSSKWQPPRQFFARGTYFRLRGASPFHHLVYPLPDTEGGLGVHATLDLQGQVKFGPDVEWLDVDTDPDTLDWKADQGRAERFYASIRQYWPNLADNFLEPDYTGVRPKLEHPNLIVGDDLPFADFRIASPREHGIPGLYHLFGIESPGLTSAMALAEHIAQSLEC